jgi:hypothetical protein
MTENRSKGAGIAKKNRNRQRFRVCSSQQDVYSYEKLAPTHPADDYTHLPIAAIEPKCAEAISLLSVCAGLARRLFRLAF